MFLKADQNHDILCSYFNIKKAICQRIMSSATIKSISRYHLQDQMLSKYYEADADLPLLRRQFVSKTSAMRDEIFRGVLPSDPVKSVSGDSVARANRCVFGDLWVLKQVFYGPLIKFNCLTSSHFTVKYQSLMSNIRVRVAWARERVWKKQEFRFCSGFQRKLWLMNVRLRNQTKDH